VIARIHRYVRGSFPPALYLPYAVLWSLGMSAAFALGDSRIPLWRPDFSTVRTVLTFCVLLLLARAVDDLRDVEYDRACNPGRPLASGTVRVSDLGAVIALGAVVALALNAGRGGVEVVLAVQLGYTVLILLVDRVLHWPSGDNLLVSGIVSFPVQLLLNLYLYAGILHQAGVGPSWHAVLPMLVAVSAFVHLEYARKLTRKPAPGERSYVTALGPSRTGMVAVLAAVVAVVLGLVLTAGMPLVLIPLVFLGYGGYRFWLARATRWPPLAAVLFLLSSFLTYLVVDLIGTEA
jgi:4-hydroxybenzoate polyprenyltransferase